MATVQRHPSAPVQPADDAGMTLGLAYDACSDLDRMEPGVIASAFTMVEGNRVDPLELLREVRDTAESIIARQLAFRENRRRERVQAAGGLPSLSETQERG